jgi:hypothetical protein
MPGAAAEGCTTGSALSTTPAFLKTITDAGNDCTLLPAVAGPRRGSQSSPQNLQIPRHSLSLDLGLQALSASAPAWSLPRTENARHTNGISATIRPRCHSSRSSKAGRANAWGPRPCARQQTRPSRGFLRRFGHRCTNEISRHTCWAKCHAGKRRRVFGSGSDHRECRQS